MQKVNKRKIEKDAEHLFIDLCNAYNSFMESNANDDRDFVGAYETLTYSYQDLKEFLSNSSKQITDRSRQLTYDILSMIIPSEVTKENSIKLYYEFCKSEGAGYDDKYVKPRLIELFKISILEREYRDKLLSLIKYLDELELEANDLIKQANKRVVSIYNLNE